MVAAFDYCLHGKGGAAPSIDTAMHGLVDAPHVDHLHPDAGIALATAADGEALTRAAFGDRVAWVPWRRPGFQLGLDIAADQGARTRRPWASCSAGTASPRGARRARSARPTASTSSAPPRPTSTSTGRPSRSGRCSTGTTRCPSRERRARAAALAPLLRGLASTDRPQVGHLTDSDVVLDFVSRAEHPRLAALGTSCPDHFLRTKVKPMVLDLPPSAPLEDVSDAAARAARGLPRRLRRLLRAQRGPGQPADARRRPRGRPRARRRDVQLRREQADRPGGGRVLRQRDQRHARRRGAEHLRADRRGREVPDRVLGAGGGQAAAHAAAEAAGHPRRPGHRGGVRHRPGHREAARRGGGVRRPRRPRPREGAGGGRRDRGSGRRGRGRRRRERRRAGRRRRPRGRARLRRARPRREQRRAVDQQAAAGDHRARLGPAARRHGQGQLPRLPRDRPGDDRAGDGRRHRLHLEQELAVRRPEQRRLRGDQGRPGPPGAPAGRRAGRAPDPGQRREPRRRRPRVRHLRRRLGRQAGRGVRRARGGARRVLRQAHPARARGAARALRGRGLRAHRRRARPARTGLHVPVDSGVAAAFLR